MLNSAVFRWTLAACLMACLTPAKARAADAWAIAPGQEAKLEAALSTTPAWPKGWAFTGANIDRGVIDARYRNPAGVGMGVRLQHAKSANAQGSAGSFEISNISAELPDDVRALLQKQLDGLADFQWTPLHDREGDTKNALPAEPTGTVQAQGDALIAAGKTEQILPLSQANPQPDCATRAHWVAQMVANRQAQHFAVAKTLGAQAPACPSAQIAVARWTATLGKPAEGEAILREVLKAGDDLLVQVDLALLLRQQQRCGDALAVLDKLDLAKVPGIATELARLSRIYIDCPDEPLLKRMQTRADATPPDAIAAFVVGSILHHLGKWQEADTYLKRSETLMKDEPRQYLYQAMDAFHLGRQADAERLVAQAASLGSSDPDVLYCRAMIFSEGKIDQAIADLQAYDKLMSTTLDKTPGKQQHVEEILAELQACRGAKDPQQCRQLRRASRVVVAWLPGLTVVALALFALVRWRRRK